MKRRHLLTLSLLPAGLPLARAVRGGTADAFVAVSDGAAAPLFKAGDHLLADPLSTAFAGAGLYLYPDWGRPRAYLVRETAPGVLGFFSPAGRRLLWTMPARGATFAGRVTGWLPARDEAGIALLYARHSELFVPELPPAGEASPAI